MTNTFPMKKNTATRIVFPILDADGDPVTSAAGLDSEYSCDGASFTNCTNEATEIATSSGVYYLDLVAGETNGDVVAIQVKTSTTGAKTTVLVFYTSAQTLNDVDTVVDAIKAKTDNLPASPANEATLTTIDGLVDAIKAKTDNLPATPADDTSIDAQLGTIDGIVDAVKLKTDLIPADIATQLDTNIPAIKTKTDNLPADPADESDIEFLLNAISAQVSEIHDITVTDVPDIKAKTDLIPADIATQLDTNIPAIKAITDLLSLASIADAVIDEVIEAGATSVTVRKALNLILSAEAGKTNGGGTATLKSRNINDSKDRITMTVDGNGNRSAVTLDGS